MKQSLVATVIEKYRGRSVATFVRRLEQRLWERRLERAVEEAHRLVEEYRRGERRSR